MADPKNRNLIAERDKRARKERAGGMKRSGGGSAPIKRTQPTRRGPETATEGDDRYNSAEDRWARLTGTGRYANTPENNWARMTGTGEFADGGGGEARLNRERMFNGADYMRSAAAQRPAMRERALGGMADFRQESGANSFGKTLARKSVAGRIKKQSQKQPRGGGYVNPAFRDSDGGYVNPAFRNRTAFPNMGG